jgi:hypothetical protein
MLTTQNTLSGVQMSKSIKSTLGMVITLTSLSIVPVAWATEWVEIDKNADQVLAGKNLITGETFNNGDKAPVRKAAPSSITAKLIDYACTGN